MTETFSPAKHWSDGCPTEEQHVAETITKQQQLTTSKEQRRMKKKRHSERRAAMALDHLFDAGADGAAIARGFASAFDDDELHIKSSAAAPVRRKNRKLDLEDPFRSFRE